jgi:hypothetical protein
MTYLYERLGPERFQHFCQALLVKDYSDLQCFPVAQPDGGRDALSRDGAENGEMTVVQVKFKRSDETPTAEWMIAALEGELPKIKKLIKRGAKRYIMTTNASSTAHLDKGRHDLVQAWLDENVDIPAAVYWRDELDRRVDGASSALKLSYPSILTGDDALTLIIAAQMGPARDRIARTLKAFVGEQFRKDEEVKFRQVDLTNSLLDLFVDVPVLVSDLLFAREPKDVDPVISPVLRELVSAQRDEEYELETRFQEERIWYGPTANTADVLLDARLQSAVPWVILQGAPGQGKSTIAQYVCQVHRARLLDRKAFLERIPEKHAAAAFRLPLKVDLRDFAAYLDGQPYLNVANSDAAGLKSLERFLASLISIQSGGLEFSPDDFAEAASSAPILIFLDGLDEVANLKLRRTLIEAVLQGLNRLRDTEVDVQVVVTTRPSLFGRKLGLGTAFKRLELAPIGASTVSVYCEKWTLARRLDDDRAREVRAILQQKLDQPHIRELTRNPMQLAILLNLIHSVGHSLPDARTSLYSEYVNLFMNREAEKSDAVRKYRAIISGIVEHLAWLLQSSAESAKGSGSIGEAPLREVVDNYLERNKLDRSIADEVFENGIERVWVLVQRVEGLFEFEVQPLREYFAAKHLYATAPTIHFRHDEGGGDRSERFEAIASNPYWANVARFYAGFYQPGELAGIARSLKELSESDDPAVRYIARNVGVELIADWIFFLKVGIQEEVVDLAFDDVGFGLAALDASPYQRVELPTECGRDRVADAVTDAIVGGDARIGSLALSTVLRNNGGVEKAPLFAAWVESSSGLERTRRIQTAIKCGAVADGESALALITGDDPSAVDSMTRIRLLCSSRTALLNDSPELAELAIDTILDGGGFRVFTGHPIGALANALNAEHYSRANFKRGAEPANDLLPARAREFIEWCDVSLAPMFRHGRMSLTSIEQLIEQGRKSFGDRWAMLRLAAVHAGSFTMPAGKVDTVEIADEQTPLFRRATLARAYRGRPGWWEERLRDSDQLQTLFWLTILFCWAPSNHVADNLPVIEEVVGALDEASLWKLRSAVDSGSAARDMRGGKARKLVDASLIQNETVAYLLWSAFGANQLEKIPERARSSKELIRDVADRTALEDWQRFPGWSGLTTKATQTWLEKLRRVHASNYQVGRLHGERAAAIPLPVAETIVAAYGEYPSESAAIAYSSIMMRYQPEPVAAIARKQGWALQ